MLLFCVFFFQELYHSTELDDQESDFCFGYTKSQRGSNRHTQGGSLQDLAETNKLDESFGRTKKHHHQRHHKNSSVSSRQREGGSLPTNVNYSLSHYMGHDEPGFLREEHKKKLKAMKQDGKKESQYIEEKPGHTVIDIGECDMDETQHLLAHDSLAQTIHDPYDDFGAELKLCHKIPRPRYMSQAKIEISESSNPSGGGVSSAMRSHSHHQSVDKTVSFDLIDNSSKNSVDTTPIQLNLAYPAVKSIVDTKNDARAINQSILTNVPIANTRLIPIQNMMSVGVNFILILFIFFLFVALFFDLFFICSSFYV